MRIVDILLKNGYVKTEGANIFSSSIPGGSCHKYKKGDRTVIVGFGEYGHPPSLLSPSPYMFDHAKNIGWVDKSTDEEIINFIENFKSYGHTNKGVLYREVNGKVII
jgi:hypothetical protein